MRSMWPILLLILLLPLLFVGTALFTGLSLWATEETEPTADTPGDAATPTRGAEAELRGSARPAVEEAPEAAPIQRVDTDERIVEIHLRGPAWDAKDPPRPFIYFASQADRDNADRGGGPAGFPEGKPGTLQLLREHARGHHIRVRVPGFLPETLDGSRLAKAGEMTVVLEPAPATHIRVEGVPEELRTKLVLFAYAVARDARPVQHHPGPDTLAALWSEFSKVDEDFTATYTFETRADVHVRARLEGYAAIPAALDVGHQGGSFVLRMHPSAVLTVAPKDLPRGMNFRLTVHREGVTREVDYDLERVHVNEIDGRYIQRVDTDLSPGRYSMRLEAPHHETLHVAFDVNQPGESIRLEPTFQRLVPLGRLELRALLPPGLTVKDPGSRECFNLWIRGEGAEGWTSPSGVTMSWRESTLSIPGLPAGAHDLLLWETQAYHVAYVGGVVVKTDKTTRLDVSLERGRRFALRPLDDAGLIASDALSSGVALRAPNAGALPFCLGGFAGEDIVEALGDYDGLVVGPFPFERVFASWKGEDGTRQEAELPVER